MKKLLIFAALPFFLVSCNTSKTVSQSSSTKKDISLQLYSLRDDISKDYEGTIKIAGKMGYTSIEAANYGDGKFYGKTPEEFKADLQAAGMYALSSHTSKGLSKDELKSKDFSPSMKWWDQCIAAHKAAGMKYIVAPSMEVPKTLDGIQT